jgi:DNA-binding MarR family transcriptional regulator
VSGSTTRRLVDDGLAERRDASMSRDKPGIRRGRYTRLTAAGRIIAAQLAAEQSASENQPRELVSTA